MFRFPWGDMHSLNLGWFLQKFNELREDWATAEAGIDGALDAEIQKAEDALSDVFDARDAAAASATAAAGSASAAGTSATAAQNSATAAASSATLANNKATAAGLSEAAAAQSATQAGNSATAAAGSATQANQSATNAAGSATAAGNSATTAAGSATAAGNSATAAAGSATAAAESAEDAEAAAERATETVAIADFINNNWPSRIPYKDMLSGSFLTDTLEINKNIITFITAKSASDPLLNFSFNGITFSTAVTPLASNRISYLAGKIAVTIKVLKGKIEKEAGGQMVRFYFVDDTGSNNVSVWVSETELTPGYSYSSQSSSEIPAGNYGLAIQLPGGVSIDANTKIQIDIGFVDKTTGNVVNLIRPINSLELTNETNPEENE